VSKSYTLKVQAFIAPLSQSQLESAFMIAFFYRALEAGAQQSLPMSCEGNSDFQFRFDDGTILNRY